MDALGCAEVLNEVLQAIKLRSVVYSRSCWTAPWGYYSKAPSQPRFHFVLNGQCWFSVENFIGQTHICEGDLVIVAPAQAYSMRDKPGSSAQLLEAILEQRSAEEKKERTLHRGGGGEVTRMLCGRFLLEESSLNPLARSLPPALIVRGESDASGSLRSAFYVMEAEFSAGRPGAEAVVTRLMDVIFLQAIRSSFGLEQSFKPGWIGALQDPAIGRALVTIHAHLNSGLSVDALARECGMSRSAFARRFTQLVGEPPISYVARWRMNRAAHLLHATDEKIARVAARVGYDSVAALTRAFKKHLGLAPGAYRHQFSVASKGFEASQSTASEFAD